MTQDARDLISGLRQPELLVDLYELTMAQSYYDHKVLDSATFSLFVRRLPPDRGYLVAAGLEDVLRFLEGFHFSRESIDHLRSLGIFSSAFLNYLSTLRFTGDVWAIPEGRLLYADEPLVELTAPAIEAQIVETFLINQVNMQTLIASKAARCVDAAQGRALVDFSLRRTQGVDAGLKTARVCHLVGFQATSNVLAGELYGIPVSGTMAHSFVTAYEHELDAFRAFAATFPERCVLLIDTYDTLDGARKAVRVAHEMKERGQRLAGVRLDSGDLFALSSEVRRILNAAGLDDVQIVASGGLDEFEIETLVRNGAPIDAFGVGTKMGVSEDAPYLDIAYKMVSFGDRDVLKLSTGKTSLPGAKQVYRVYDQAGSAHHDVIAARLESTGNGEPLLVKMMEQGRRTTPACSLEESRRWFEEDRRRLPPPYRRLRNPSQYRVDISPGLADQARAIGDRARTLSAQELGES
jgi:nicotinate phosphoribosyltransferase